MKPAFIIGCGDIGQRTAKLWMAQNGTVSALVRSLPRAQPLADLGIALYQGDLDDPASLRDLPAKDAVFFYFAPPPQEGRGDPRLRAVLAMLTSAHWPVKVVYISTTGVYGDCQGGWVTEQTPAQPRSERGARRCAAESALLDWHHTTGVPIVILRVPGIYGPGRLPVERIKQGIPVLREEESPYSNRIHADDLAQICVAAAKRGRAGEIYNVSDGHPSTMTDYFYRVADLLGLPHPPALSMTEARQRLTPGMLSFIEESRRIDNRKMLEELEVKLLYPDLKSGLAACLTGME